MNPLLAKLKKTKGLPNPELKSFAGYPVKSSAELGLDNYFNADGKKVAGMAWGGKTNPLGQGGGEPSSIVANPNYFKGDTRGKNALIKLEASRHYMSESGDKPKFKITPEMSQWREQFNPVKAGPAGKAYYTDDDAFRQTVVSRAIGGDQNLPKMSDEAIAETSRISQGLSLADQKVQSAKVRSFVENAVTKKRPPFK